MLTRRVPAPDVSPELSELIERRSGLRLGGPRRQENAAVIRRAMRTAGVGSADEYRQLLERDDIALDRLVAALAIGETCFFRERPQIEMLRRVILPEVINRRGASHNLQVWSAGCATGEEAYSLAVVLADAGATGRVLGTDVSRANLAKAEAGVYDTWSLRGVEPRELTAHIEPLGARFRMRSSVAGRVSFAARNLLEGPPGREQFDIVFCRNVLIYLTAEAVAAAVETLSAALAPAGWLVTASSDPHLDSNGLARVRTPHGIAYRRRHGRARALHRASPASVLRPSRAPHAATVAPTAGDLGARAPGDEAPPAAGAHAGVSAPDGVEAGSAAAYASRVAALAGGGQIDAAIEACEAGVRAHPLDAGLHYLRGLLYLAAGSPATAAAAADAALYLQPDLAVGHVLRAEVSRRLGNRRSAERSTRNARRVLAAVAPDTEVPFGEGERAGRMLAAIETGLATRGASP